MVVGYPVGGSVTLAFHASMLRLLGYELPKGDKRLLAKINHTQGLYVGDNRTALIERFLAESDAEWLLQIDTDIEFPPTLLETMVKIAGRDKKVVAASVPLDGAPTCGYMLTDEPGVWTKVPQILGDLMEVDGVATAVLLTHRKVFEDIADRHGQCWMHHIYVPSNSNPKDVTPRNFKYLCQGEDLAFCVRVKEAGHRVWCAYVPGLRHHKGRALSHDFERAGIAADQAAGCGVGELVDEGAA